MTKLLTIWIPTFQRPQQLARLIANLSSCGLSSFADIVISDNDPNSSKDLALAQLPAEASAARQQLTYIRNPSNLTAGINFLRAFEYTKTPWLMIVGDDDLFDARRIADLQALLHNLDPAIAAVKFDSSLFGMQRTSCVPSLKDYVIGLQRSQYPEAFNNLCLISNWLFRPEPFLQNISSAFLGYSSKISHLFPVLRACAESGQRIQFSGLQPVIHGSTAESSWPKAATWAEMIITMSCFSGFIDRSNRRAILTLLLHSDWRRYVAKCLRIQQFYGGAAVGISPWRIHGQLCLLSLPYLSAFLLSLPLLALPQRLLPKRIRRRIGEPGSVDRW
jgi:hypothetical protein